jgi:hypothetical protein
MADTARHSITKEEVWAYSNNHIEARADAAVTDNCRETQASIGQPFGQMPIGVHRQLTGTRTGRGGPFSVYQQSAVLIGVGCWDGQGTVALALLAVNLSADDKPVRYRLICRLESEAQANVRAHECGLVRISAPQFPF